jgi:alpha-beta hydrolase superfamily lysophospholipase
MRRIARLVGPLVRHLTVAVIGFIVGALVIYIHLVRSGPPLELWHTTELTEEFAVDRADEVRTFADYRRMEERLFAQMDREVYAHTQTGPTFELARYSAGSAVDLRGRKPDWNQSFELTAKTPAGGVLLLHGMSDSPYSFRALGKALNQRNYWVIGLRLPGHGTIPSGLKTVSWEDMAFAVRLHMEHLAARVGQTPIHIMGYSTGAPLALNYALDALDGIVETTPASLVLLSPAIAISPAAVLAKWKARLSILPGLEKLAWTQILPEFDPYKYNSFTSNAGVQVHRITRDVAMRIEALAAAGPIEDFPPTLVFLSAIDATVSTDAVIDNLLEHLAPDRHELVLFDINRNNVKSSILVSDPGPLTARLLADQALPFHLSLIANESAETNTVVSRRKPPLSKELTTRPLNLTWPRGVISLSHVALPVPPNDPLYGQRQYSADNVLNLGQLDIQGERGLLKFPSSWLLRLRYNPFYDFLENRVIEWMDEGAKGTPKEAVPAE